MGLLFVAVGETAYKLVRLIVQLVQKSCVAGPVDIEPFLQHWPIKKLTSPQDALPTKLLNGATLKSTTVS